MSSYDGNVESVPLTSPGGVVQSGGYMSAAGPDRSPAVGISQMQPVDSGGGSGGGLGDLASMIGSLFAA